MLVIFRVSGGGGFLMEKLICFTARDPAPACSPAPQRCCGECTYALDDADSVLFTVSRTRGNIITTPRPRKGPSSRVRGESNTTTPGCNAIMGISKSPPCPASSVPKIMHWLAEHAAKQDLDATVLKAGERSLTCPRQQRILQSSVGTSPRYPFQECDWNGS